MTKKAAVPIYDKNTLKIFFSRTISQMTLKLGTQEKGRVLEGLYKWWSWVGLDLFYNKVNFVHLGFYIGKARPHFQKSSPLKPLDRLKSDFIWNIYASRE